MHQSPLPAAVLMIILVCAVFVPTVTAAPFVGTFYNCTSPGYPTADFKMTLTSETETLLVFDFQDISAAPSSGHPITSWKWDFGDGTTSTARNPRHTFSPGGYTITLNVSTVCGSRYSDFKTLRIYLYCTNPLAGFTTDKSEGTAPLTVRITDTSKGTTDTGTSWKYTFDGTHTSSQRNPVFTYQNPGTYTLVQTITKACACPVGTCSTIRPENYTASHQIKVYAPVHGFSLVNSSSLTPTPTTAPSEVLTTTTAATGVPTTFVTSFSQNAPAQNSPTGAPSSPGTGTLSVVTDPPGAAIFLDDVTWGASPASIPNLAVGSHILRLEKAGYRTMSVPVTVTDGKTAEYSLALIPESSGGTGTLPLNPLTVVIALAGAGGFVYRAKKKTR